MSKDDKARETPEERFTTAQWSGLPNYRCAACAFETTNWELIHEHVDASHGPAGPSIAVVAAQAEAETAAASLKAKAPVGGEQ